MGTKFIPLNKEQIEGIAVDAVRASVRTTRYLVPYINEHDKEPIWDGYISINMNPNFKTEEPISRVFVQVKGKYEKIFPKKIKYSVKVKYLKNFLNKCGAIFFVVYVNENEKQVYYKELAPILLRHYLNNINQQKEISIEFMPFPRTNLEKENLFINFFENCQNQISFVRNNNVLTLSDLYSKKDLISGFHVSFYHTKDTNFHDVFLTQETYLYAKIKDIGINIPIDYVIKEKYIMETSSLTVRINDRIYYNSVERVDSNTDYKEIRIGKAIRILFDVGNEKITIKYDNPKFVKDIVCDLEFWRDVIINEGFYLGDDFIPIYKSKAISAGFDLDDINVVLIECQKYVKVLEYLNCKRDLEYKKLTNKNRDDLNALYDSLILKKNIGLRDNADCLRVALTIQKLTFFIMVTRVDKEKNLFKVEDYFSEEVKISFQPKNDFSMILLPKYCFLKKEELMSVDNLCLEKIVPSIKKFDKSELLVNFSATLLIDLCEAYAETKDNKFLLVAKDLYIWVNENLVSTNYAKEIENSLIKYKVLLSKQEGDTQKCNT